MVDPEWHTTLDTKQPISHAIRNELGEAKVPLPGTLTTSNLVEKWLNPIRHKFETFDEVISR